MPDGFLTARNKHQIHPKVHFSEYIQYENEPMDYAADNAPTNPRTEQLISNFFMRRRIRHFIVRMRHHAS